MRHLENECYTRESKLALQAFMSPSIVSFLRFNLLPSVKYANIEENKFSVHKKKMKNNEENEKMATSRGKSEFFVTVPYRSTSCRNYEGAILEIFA